MGPHREPDVSDHLPGQPRLLHNISSKGAIASMTRSLARELGPDGITVNAITPGLTMTRNMKDSGNYPNEVVKQAVAAQSTPTQEQPSDLVGACLFLVGDGASMMAGQVLHVDGGTRPLSASDSRLESRRPRYEYEEGREAKGM